MIEQVRQNKFFRCRWGRKLKEQHEKTILKEEFYRTFIIIAGQVPVWIVLPSGLDDEKYLENSMIKH